MMLVELAVTVGLAVGGVKAEEPPKVPVAVRRMERAAEKIARKPYVWGGGHGSFKASGYDCSGSVSYVLAAADRLERPMVSGALAGYGKPGKGRWVTIYANSGHVWMQIRGRRFDTIALKATGSRLTRTAGDKVGYTVRHPAGL